ncbi:MAG: NAD(P)-dependent oxidoreductase [Micromonosporaceae bacterium]
MPEPLTGARGATDDPAAEAGAGAGATGLRSPAGSADVAVLEGVWGEPFARLSDRLSVRRISPQPEPDQLPDCLAGTSALVVRNRTQVTRDLLGSLPRLQVVARAGVGLDNIDVAAADDLGVVVLAALGANAVSVAEHTLGAALAVARQIATLDRHTRDGGWDRRAGRELAGGTWGLLGLGATGRAVSRLALALRMHVVAYDPYVARAEPEVRLASLEETAAAADVLSIHLPATPQTNRLVNSDLLATMRPEAILVNVGRGEVVDEAALADALEAGRLAGAALDVRATEPPVPGRLERLDNVLLTPHVAGITAQSQHRIATVLADDIARVLSGERARDAVGAVRQAREVS